MRNLRLTITVLPKIELEPWAPMYGKPQQQKFSYQIHEFELKGEIPGDSTQKLQGGVDSSVEHIVKRFLEKATA